MAVNIRGDLAGHLLINEGTIANEALYRLRHELMLPRLVSHSYNKYFENKIGNELTIPLPFRTKVGTGRDIGATDDPLIDRSVTIKVDKRVNFHMSYTDEELTMDIESFGGRYVQPGVEAMAQYYEEKGAEELCNGIGASVDGVATGLTVENVNTARAMALDMAIPNNDSNYALMSPTDLTKIWSDLKALHLPDTVGQALKRRYKGTIADFEVFATSNLPNYEGPVNVADITGAIDGASQKGSSINIDGVTVSSTVYKKGQLIKIAGVNFVKPAGDFKTLPYEATFTVMEDATSDSSGNVAVKIAPEINDGTLTMTDGTGSNVTLSAWKNVDSLPANNAVVTVVGTKGKNHNQVVFFEKNVMQYINVELVQADSLEYKGKAVDDMTGLSIGIAKQTNIQTMVERIRADSLFGVKTTYPDLGIRLITKEI